MATRTIHPFPARMAPEIALDAIPVRDQERLTVIDPMCGSGTVLAVALQRGHDAIGIDIDPLAVMMSRLSVTRVETEGLKDVVAGVIEEAKAQDGTSPWGDDSETEKFVNYWFGQAQKRQLIALTSAVQAVPDEDWKLTLEMAISRIIISKSPRASLAADTSHSRPHRVLTSSDYDVLDGFAASATQLTKILDRRVIDGSGTAQLGDARDLGTIEAGAADMAVTSPPYLNALDYLRGHKLALVWFGYKISELRARRGISIGSERAHEGERSEAVDEIVDVIESEAVDPAVLKRPMLDRFAHDCLGFASQLHRAIKPGGTAVLVVGNSTLRGNYIRNSLITEKAMEYAGFELKDSREREIPPSRRYMAISAKNQESSITKRMRTEVILTMER